MHRSCHSLSDTVLPFAGHRLVQFLVLPCMLWQLKVAENLPASKCDDAKDNQESTFRVPLEYVLVGVRVKMSIALRCFGRTKGVGGTLAVGRYLWTTFNEHREIYASSSRGVTSLHSTTPAWSQLQSVGKAVVKVYVFFVTSITSVMRPAHKPPHEYAIRALAYLFC
jgi:hypothetical protein